MEDRTATTRPSFVIPARTLSGSLEQMLAEIDEAVEALLAVRQRLVVSSSRALLDALDRRTSLPK